MSNNFTSLMSNTHYSIIVLLSLIAMIVPARGDEALKEIAVENKVLALKLSPEGLISVLDKRIGKTWSQQMVLHQSTITSVTFMGALPNEIIAEGFCAELESSVKIDITLADELPEFSVSIAGDGDQPKSLSFPQPFVGGTDLIIPINEGVRCPVNDPAMSEMRLITYGGHSGISMPFWGLTDGDASQMAIIETPDDGCIQLKRLNGTLCVMPQWNSQKGKFGYERRIRYSFFDHGGYVAMCKYYREHAKATGLFKTLDEKRRQNPKVDLLIGAANVWYWREQDSVQMAREMIDAKITRMLWSNSLPPYVVDLNKLGLLTGRYDIYQDIMNPAMYSQAQYVMPQWITQAWPSQCVVDAKGKLVDGWKAKLKDGNRESLNERSESRSTDQCF